MKKSLITVFSILTTIAATSVQAQTVTDRQKRLDAFNAHEKVHAEDLAAARAAAPAKERERREREAAFAAHEKVHAQELAASRAAAPAKLAERRDREAAFAAQEKQRHAKSHD